MSSDKSPVLWRGKALFEPAVVEPWLAIYLVPSLHGEGQSSFHMIYGMTQAVENGWIEKFNGKKLRLVLEVDE